MKGRLARRTFALLLAAALLPIAIVTWLILSRTEAYVHERAQRTLTAEAKKYGLAVFARLDLAARAVESAGSEALPSALTPFFSEARWISAAEWNDVQPPAGHSTILFIVREGEERRLAFLHRVDEGRWRLAVLHAEYLWQPNSLLADVRVRVRDAEGTLLFASESSSTEQAVVAEEPVERATWELFLDQRFSAGRWRIEFLQAQSDVRTELSEYRRILWMTLVPLVATLVLLSSVLIRRSHRPLEALVDATHRVAAGDFRSELVPTGDPDTRGLIVAFNAMAAQIGRQFETLAVLSQIDRLIVSSSDLQSIVGTMLAHTQRVLPCELVGLLLVDENCPDIAQVFVCQQGDATVQPGARLAIPSKLRELLQSTQSVRIAPTSRVAADLHELLPLAHREWTWEWMPVCTDRGVQGALLLAANASGSSKAVLTIARGLTERMAVALSNAHRQDALIRQAHYDALTQLPNRLLFKDRLAQQIVHCQRSRGQFALLFLDLDRFKNINDSFGHTSGDELLQAVAARFVAELKNADTIARLGGDEFTVITAQIASARDAANAAQGVLAALSRPVAIGNVEHFVSASIGVALYPQDGTTTDELLRNADVAMYRAKAAGPGRFAFYEEEMNREAMQRVELENDLRHALAREELFLMYQPCVRLSDQTVVGVEALCRWQHPRLGLIAPDRFIRVAEDSGLILPIGDRVLRQACEQFRHWRDTGVVLHRLAVNVSMRQLQAPGFVQRLKEIVSDSHIGPGVLEIEITESVLAGDIAYVAGILNELHAAGVQIAIDDFGTGYSSLSYLQRLPIDTLKIDRAFLPKQHDASSGSVAVCQAILAMSRALKLTTIAEGVETPEHVEFLVKHGCAMAQGFYFSRPVSAQEIARRLSGMSPQAVGARAS